MAAKRILLVEDEEEIAEILALVLRGVLRLFERGELDQLILDQGVDEALRLHLHRLALLPLVDAAPHQLRDVAAATLRPKLPVPFVARPAIEYLNLVTTALLPDWLRAELGLAWGPTRARLHSAQRTVIRRLMPALPGLLREFPQPAGRVLFATLVALGAYAVQFKLFRTNGLLWSLAVCSLLVPLIDRVLPGSRYQWRRSP